MKHTPPSEPLTDEQLLFTPEEMSGDIQSAAIPDDSADANTATDTPVAATDMPETPVEEAPTTSDATPVMPQKHVESTGTPAPANDTATDATPTDEDNDTFTDEQRIITEMTIALEFVDTLSLGQVRLIALEASVIWQNGVRPGGTYAIQSMPRYTFDGYKFLALYYVTFYKAFPSMIEKLNLPFDRLYLLARRRYDGYRPKH